MSTKVDFAIVTPLEEERLAMLAQLPAAQSISGGNRDPRIYYKTKLPVFRDGKEGVYDLVISDLLSMGRVDAAIVAKDLMRRWSPRYILLVGIAGGLQRAGVRVGDVLIADKIVDPEQQKLTGKGREIRWSPHLADPCMLEASNQLTPDHWQAKNGRPRHFAGAECGTRSHRGGEFPPPRPARPRRAPSQNFLAPQNSWDFIGSWPPASSFNSRARSLIRRPA